MKVTYWSGMILGVTSCLVLSAVFLNGWHRSASTERLALVFDPPYLSASQPWILPGGTRELTVQLKNLTTQEALIEDLRFSCACAQGTIAGTKHFPVRIPAGDSVEVIITVTSQKGESGPVELRYGVVGRMGDQPIDVGATASLVFVQHLNAEPSLLTFGSIKNNGERSTATVELWVPRNGDLPGAELQVESDDPCVRVRLDRLPDGNAFSDEGSRRLCFARLAVTIDPAIMPERLKTHVTVRAGSAELRLPVLAILDQNLVTLDE